MKPLFNFSVFFSAMALMSAHSTVIVPSGFANEEGTSTSGDGTSLGLFNNTVQTVYNESLLVEAGLNAGDVLNGLSFRVNAGNAAPNFRVDEYIIRLSTSNFSAGSLEADFSANRGADFTTVRSGSLVFNAADYDVSSMAPSGGSGTPNAFGPVIIFGSTFTYQGGDLLLEYTHTPPEGLNGEEAVLSQADAVINFDDGNGGSLVQSAFSDGFDTGVRGFNDFGLDFAPIVQFSVIPEPSVSLLSGIAFLGLLRRRR